MTHHTKTMPSTCRALTTYQYLLNEQFAINTLGLSRYTGHELHRQDELESKDLPKMIHHKISLKNKIQFSKVCLPTIFHPTLQRIRYNYKNHYP